MTHPKGLALRLPLRLQGSTVDKSSALLGASLPVCAVRGSHFRLSKSPSSHRHPGILDASADLNLLNTCFMRRTEQAQREDRMSNHSGEGINVKKDMKGQVFPKEVALQLALDIGFFFFLFKAPPAACGSSQARGQIRGAAASLHHSHGNTISEPYL